MSEDIKIGIAEVSSLDTELARLKKSIAQGYHGSMGFLARDIERRCDPGKIMPECKSVIVAAMGYDSMPQLTNSQTHELKNLPKYLQHKDYHVVMMEKLQKIVAEIKQDNPDVQYKCYVDTGPILEKAWAVRAGLGFIGKNTLLISPTMGSQMALGIILTSISPPSLTLSLGGGGKKGGGGHCINCTACIDSCPTGAIVAPYTLDARKCVSYKFFIEKKTGGCDICQDVCPFNKLMGS